MKHWDIGDKVKFKVNSLGDFYYLKGVITEIDDSRSDGPKYYVYVTSKNEKGDSYILSLEALLTPDNDFENDSEEDSKVNEIINAICGLPYDDQIHLFEQLKKKYGTIL